MKMRVPFLILFFTPLDEKIPDLPKQRKADAVGPHNEKGKTRKAALKDLVCLR